MALQMTVTYFFADGLQRVLKLEAQSAGAWLSTTINLRPSKTQRDTLPHLLGLSRIADIVTPSDSLNLRPCMCIVKCQLPSAPESVKNLGSGADFSSSPKAPILVVKTTSQVS